ncbi:MAG: type III pantothenate kinase [Planctomycetaceae bacterium]|nr:type III pantothenate kinase [Planctomycetaceae bacterium]
MTDVQLIAVDIGNSLTKVGWFEDVAATLPQPSSVRRFFTGQPPPEALFDGLPAKSVRWRVASVNREGQRVLTESVRSRRPQDDVRILGTSDMPIAVRVEHPESVGTDRLAAAVAANVLRDPDRAAIVVGAGTALVVNVVSRDGAFVGGVILAGFRMQAKALYDAADLLPLAEWKSGSDPPPVIGTNTEAAIQSGLFWGAVGAVRELVARIAGELGHAPQVFVTGGDLARLAPLVGEETRFVPNMVLSGIAVAARGQ